MHDKNLTEVLQSLDTDSTAGLTDTEARLRRTKHGDNMLPSKRPIGIVRRFFSQFADMMTIILLVAAAISFAMALWQGEDVWDCIIIVAIVILNAALGTAQEHKAQKSLQALKQLSARKVRVLRDGVVTIIDSEELTFGDIILLSAGDIVPADCRLVEGAGVTVNEAALTGESLNVTKNANAKLKADTPLAQRSNILYCGTFLQKGNCKAVVYAIGAQTEMGKIASLLRDTADRATPMQQRLKKLSALIGALCLAVCAAVMIVALVKGISTMKPDEHITTVLIRILLDSISLAVAAIPEGLLAIVTIVMARGVQTLAQNRAVVRRLPAVETLGSATVICSDKTGTLTMNAMHLQYVYDGKLYDIDSNTKLSDSAKHVLRLSALCCELTEQGTTSSDATEAAIIECAQTLGIDYGGERIAEYPFDSDRKKMTVITRDQKGLLSVTKGAPDIMARDCVNGGKFVKQCAQLSARGYRVLAVAVKRVDQSVTQQKAESGMTLVGLIAMIDPPRPEVKQAVATCRSAGIRPVMITGDSVDTATEIARQLGILRTDDIVLSGMDLSTMTDSQLDKCVDKVAVYARTTPADKLRIVEALQRQGEVVAMTGDGVNDAPALKRADIGCAMGKTGTEVAKSTADMVLTDDNFATIVEAVATGRNVFDNIRKAVFYLLSCNVGEVLTVFLSLLIFDVSPLCSMQLLWINLATDGLPAVALGMQQREQDVMNRPPQKLNEGLLSKRQWWLVCIYGVLMSLLAIAAYAVGNATDAVTATTMCFAVLAISQLFFAYETRVKQSALLQKPSAFMVISLLVSLLLVLAVIYIRPLATLFGMTSLSAVQFGACIALALVPLAITEMYYPLQGLRVRKLQPVK